MAPEDTEFSAISSTENAPKLEDFENTNLNDKNMLIVYGIVCILSLGSNSLLIAIIRRCKRLLQEIQNSILLYWCGISIIKTIISMITEAYHTFDAKNFVGELAKDARAAFQSVEFCLFVLIATNWIFAKYFPRLSTILKSKIKYLLPIVYTCIAIGTCFYVALTASGHPVVTFIICIALYITCLCVFGGIVLIHLYFSERETSSTQSDTSSLKIAGLGLVVWLPLIMVVVMEQFLKDETRLKSVMTWLAILVLLHPTMNLALCCVVRKNFKQEFKKLLFGSEDDQEDCSEDEANIMLEGIERKDKV